MAFCCAKAAVWEFGMAGQAALIEANGYRANELLLNTALE
jgi:hypothetical protein